MLSTPFHSTPFHYEENPQRIGIRTNLRPATTMILCYKSPHASPLTNYWLEHKILKLYTAYYKKVMWESMGKFWEEDSIPPMKDIYTTIYGGITNK